MSEQITEKLPDENGEEESDEELRYKGIRLASSFLSSLVNENAEPFSIEVIDTLLVAGGLVEGIDRLFRIFSFFEPLSVIKEMLGKYLLEDIYVFEDGNTSPDFYI